MISTLMDRMLDHRLLAVAVAVVLLLGGLYAFQHLSIETYPDPSPPPCCSFSGRCQRCIASRTGPPSRARPWGRAPPQAPPPSPSMIESASYS
jgi:hypothetical protein